MDSTVQTLAFGVSDLPKVNATLNTVCTVLLVLGFLLIRRRQIKGHITCMALALAVSAAFLVCYLIYHYSAGHVKFTHEGPVRTFYYILLISHVILAIVIVPMVIMTVVPALRRRYDRHTRIARMTLPLWLYVSVTGVIVYLMLYVWFPSAEAAPAVPPAKPAAEGNYPEFIGEAGLVFSPSVSVNRASVEADSFTATFSINNQTGRPVKITKVDSSCSCLSAKADRDLLRPGEAATVSATYSISKMAAGEAVKKIYVETDHPQNPRTELTVVVAIDPAFEIEPKMVTWVQGESPAPKRIRLRSLRDEPVHVVSAESSRDSVSCRVITETPGRDYWLELTPESTDKIILGMLKIETDSKIKKLRKQMAYFAVQAPGRQERGTAGIP